MKNSRLVASALALIVIAFIAAYFLSKNSAPSDNASTSELTEGTHYRLLSKPLDVSVEGVSVKEFFWYGCPHCQSFEPRIKEWLADAPSDIAFEPVPVAWNDATRLHGAMYYAGLEAERPEQLHEALFDLIIDMRQERDLDRQVEKAGELFSQHGVAADSLGQVLNSPGVKSQVKQAEKEMRAAEVSSTPSVLVGGKYLILNTDAVAEAGMFEVMNQLVELARK